MVAKEVVLQALHEPSCLYGEARPKKCWNDVAARSPFHPVDDAARNRIRIPTVALSWRILSSPAFKQILMPYNACACFARVQIIKIMQMIGPQFSRIRRLPVAC